MSEGFRRRTAVRPRGLACTFSLAAVSLALAVVPGPPVFADEGGGSFWTPGQYASFAAVPPPPGFNLALAYYSYWGSADSNIKLQKGNHLVFGMNTALNAFWLTPSYTLPKPVWGGALTFSITGYLAYNLVDVSARLQPRGLYGSHVDSITSGGDLYPNAQVAWNRGHNNWMTYLLLGVPVGSYDPSRLADTGNGHWAADLGGAYTYFDPDEGHEFSATLGFTYNWDNPDTSYKNGIDGHLDLAWSQALSRASRVGLVGYVYHQLTGDSGSGARLGGFRSSAAAIGLQGMRTFTVGGSPVSVSLRGYYELQAHRRPQGYTIYLVASVPVGGKG